jgi:hypothetical protein
MSAWSTRARITGALGRLQSAERELIGALDTIIAVADRLTPDEAAETIDDVTLQAFWRDWSDVSAWAGQLWRRLDADLDRPAMPLRDPDTDEVTERFPLLLEP